MAACSFGAPGLKYSKLNYTRIELGTVHPVHAGTVRMPARFDGFVLSQRSRFRCQCLPVQSKSSATSKDNSEEAMSSGSMSHLIPNAFEVESLLTQICDTTSIAEFELKLGGFRLYVTRDLTGESSTLPPPIVAPVIRSPVEASELNGSASSPSLALVKVEPTSGGVENFLDKAADDGLVIIQSPKVGYFRRSRTIKGNKAPPSCKEKQEVKEGQVVCFIEQLGGELPIESDISGEVIKILRQDGEPVGYGDALIAVLPSSLESRRSNRWCAIVSQFLSPCVFLILYFYFL